MCRVKFFDLKQMENFDLHIVDKNFINYELKKHWLQTLSEQYLDEFKQKSSRNVGSILTYHVDLGNVLKNAKHINIFHY